jgi:hypothetical protein
MNRSRTGMCVALFVLWSGSATLAQQQPTSPAPVNTNPPSGQNIFNFFTARTPYEFWLTCLIGALALVIIWFIVHSVRKLPNTRPDDITRPIVIVSIIFGTLILITAGFSNEQVAPAFGLYGTIIGYLLGRMGQSPAAPNEQPAALPPTTQSPVT